MSISKEVDVLAEAKVAHALAGHKNFPYCFGFIPPNRLVFEFLGTYDNNTVCVKSIDKVLRKDILNKHEWVLVSHQIVQGIKFMHNLNILHNDIKFNNVVLHGPLLTDVKIIDFGKATCINKSVVYDLSPKDVKRYNERHRYLAHELRNVPGARQSVMTDVYSVGYMLKYIGFYEKFKFLEDLGCKMRTDSPVDRVNLSFALKQLSDYLGSVKF